ncbi:sensor domain-containing diguanylate cyclase [Billgrantia azerbaijanica]|nr:sensor domain-containing diguanylate cyclase [Halomonas azerbaijanica]
MNRPNHPDSHEADLADALRNCAEAPVHHPGAIQPGGCLISLDAELSVISQVSANLEAFLGIPVHQALESEPSELLGAALLRRLARALGDSDHATAVQTTQLGADAFPFRLSAYRSGQRVVIELEPLVDEDEHHLLSVLNHWLTTVRETTSLQQLEEHLVAQVHQLTGFDRVLIYRFDERWNGSVTAESRSDGVGSLLGHHFPASDIPPQVRRLYDLNPLRSIPEASAAAVPLVPAVDPDDDTPLDLSPGVLRAVAPVHQEYLANLGVASSLSVALHDDKHLSGLLSCHALASPLTITPAKRDAVLALVQITVPHLTLLQTRAENELMHNVQISRELLSERHQQWVNPDFVLRQRGADWASHFRADGMVLSHRWQHGRWGCVPDTRALDAIIDWLDRRADSAALWYSHCLKETPLDSWRGPSSGLLAAPLPIDTEHPSWLLLFRNEEIETRRWAGVPHKQLETRDGLPVLTPRRSFAEWQEKVRDHCRVWRRSERHAAKSLAENLAAVIASHEIHLLNDRLREVNKRLERLASHDSLTGVWNRYRIEQAIEEELAAAARYDRHCALLLFDIDYFKAINDTHGHEIGDKVLISLVSCVNASLRETDRLGRWGGEEFVVLATETTAEGARELAHRLCQQVAQTHFEEVGQVTVSIGTATYQAGDTIKTLVGRADEAMYTAKKSGRNRVHDA